MGANKCFRALPLSLLRVRSGAAPERIGTLIEGEGLMNDGSAIVLFNVFKAAITTKSGLTASGVVVTGLRLSLGGVAVGLLVGSMTSFALAYFTYNDLQSEVSLTVVCCFSAFLIRWGNPSLLPRRAATLPSHPRLPCHSLYPQSAPGAAFLLLSSEGTPLHVSGVLAVVFSGLYLSFYGRGNISVKVEHSLHSFWHMAEYIADTLIFFVAGELTKWGQCDSGHYHECQ